jgi:hypothetical protein
MKTNRFVAGPFLLRCQKRYRTVPCCVVELNYYIE